MKPAAYRTKSGLLFKNEPDAPLELTPLYEMPKPLSDEEIHKLADTHLQTRNHDGALVVLGLEDFARAIEERHGIK
jgi:hypothetical protein